MWELDKTLLGNATILPKKLVVYGAKKSEVKKIKPHNGPHASGECLCSSWYFLNFDSTSTYSIVADPGTLWEP